MRFCFLHSRWRFPARLVQGVDRSVDAAPRQVYSVDVGVFSVEVGMYRPSRLADTAGTLSP